MNKINTPTLQFDHYSSKYRCCCGSVHVLQGTQIIGVLQFILAIFSSIILLFASELDPFWTILEIISLVIEISVLVALFFAIRREESKLLLPYLVYEILWVIVSVFVAILALLAIITPNGKIGYFWRRQLIEVTVTNDQKEKELEDMVTRISALFTLLSFLLSTLIAMWWIHVVYKSYIYLRNLNRARNESETSIKYSASQIP